MIHVPVDVLEAVVEFTAEVRSVLELRLVSRRWRDAVPGAFAAINGRQMGCLDSGFIHRYYPGQGRVAMRLALRTMLPTLQRLRFGHLQLGLLDVLANFRQDTHCLAHLDLKGSGAEASHVTTALQLPHVVEINLFGCTRLRDLRCFQTCPSAARITWLCLASTGVDNAGVLLMAESLSQLTWLSLAQCRAVSDIRALGDKQTPLEFLDISSTGVCDSGVAPLLQLQTFVASGCVNFGGGEFLARCPRLLSATLIDCGVSAKDVTLMALSTSLQHLILDTCRSISDVEPLGSVATLVTLSLRGTQVTSDTLWGLETLPHLAELNLARCREVCDVDLLYEAPSLHTLHLGETGVTSDGLEALIRICTLTHLNLDHCRGVDSLRHVAACQRLQWLSLSRCLNITTPVLDALASVADSLRYLDVSFCDLVTSLSFVTALVHLTHLNVASTNVSGDLAPLAHHGHLTELDVSKTRVSNVAECGRLPRLQRLVVSIPRLLVESQLLPYTCRFVLIAP